MTQSKQAGKPDWPPSRRRVFLMRHGEVDYFDQEGRAVDPQQAALNELGRRQAAAVGVALQSTPIDRVVGSGLPRSEQTAQLVLSGRAVPVEHDPRLREIETGKMSELHNTDPASVARVVLGALSAPPSPDTSLFGGETFGKCSARVLAAWADLLARPDWQTVLVVAHGIVNRLLLCHLLDAPLGSLGRLEQDAGCVNLIEVDSAGRPLVRMVNASVDDPGKEQHTLSTFEALFRQYLRGRLTPAE